MCTWPEYDEVVVIGEGAEEEGAVVLVEGVVVEPHWAGDGGNDHLIERGG